MKLPMKHRQSWTSLLCENVCTPILTIGLFYTFPASAVLNTIQLAEWGGGAGIDKRRW